MTTKHKLMSSAVWIAAGSSFNQIFGFIIFVILARLLTPTQFGVVAFASIFIDMSRQFISVGIPDALIRHNDWDQSLASTALWMNLAVSTLICLVCVAVGAPVLSAIGYEGIGPVLAVLALSLIIDASRTVLEAKMRRDFAFKAITYRNTIASVLAGILGVVMAFMGAGVWALVANRLAASALSTALTWGVVRWVPSLTFSRENARYLAKFATGLVGAQALSLLNGQIAPLIVGFFLGPASLAIYRAGYRILGMVTQLTIMPLQSAALSAFSKIKDKDSLPHAYLRLTAACSLVSCPVFIGTGAIAPDFIVLTLGAKWQEAGWIMMMGSFVTGAAVLSYFFTPVLTAAGNTKYSFYYFASAVVGNTAFALATVPFGLMAVAASQTLRAYVSAPVPLLFLRKAIGLRPMDAINGIAAPFCASLAMGGILIALRQFLLMDLPPVARLAIMLALGPCLYAGFMLTLGRKFLAKSMSELKSILPASLRARIPRFIWEI